MRVALGALLIAVLQTGAAFADDIACVSTTFRFIGANDKVCVSAFDDPKVPGVACHISQARTGGLKGTFGLAEDPSRFSIACRQIGPVATDLATLPSEEKVYSESTSIFFKHTHVFRIVDKKRNTLIYVAISDKIIEGSPENAVSTVPIMPCGVLTRAAIPIAGDGAKKSAYEAGHSVLCSRRERATAGGAVERKLLRERRNPVFAGFLPSRCTPVRSQCASGL